MVNFAQSYVAVVQNLSSSNALKDLVEHCRKENILENLEKLSVNELDRIISNLHSPAYSIGLLFALIAKNSVLSKLKNEEDYIKFLIQLQELTPNFNLEQLEFSSEIYINLFKNVTETLLAKNRPLYGINLLIVAITHLCQGSINRITSLHSHLFCLCLKAKRFDPALQFFDFDVAEFFIESSNTLMVDVKHFISFFYYAGLIYCALERYEEALLMFEHAVCVPAMGVSAIMVEALKKYILLNVLTHKKIMRLPGYKSATVQRNVVPLCSVYFKLVNIYRSVRNRRPTEINSLVMNFIEQKKSIFEKDNNIGIVLQILKSANEDLLKQLPSQSEVIRRANIKTFVEAEKLMRTLIYRQEFAAKIDKRNKIVNFDVPESTIESTILNSSMKDLITLAELVNKFDEAVRLNPTYLAKSGKSGSGFHEDEGFQMANAFQTSTNSSIP